jgi:subtilisin family serine protease
MTPQHWLALCAVIALTITARAEASNRPPLRLEGAHAVLVKLREGHREAALRQLRELGEVRTLLPHANEAFRARGLHRLYTLRTDGGIDRRAARWLATHPAVEYAQVDAAVRSLSIPDDPLFSQLWPLHNTGQTGGTADADIDALESWEVTKGAGAVVAVLDSGVDYDHPDLAGNIWTNPGEIPGNGIDDDGNGYVDDTRGWDFFNGDNDPFDDGSGHGTHVAGIIAAVQNNAIGISGAGPELKIMPLKIQSFAQIGSVSAAIEAIQYAAAMGVAVMNNSWAVSAAWGEPGFDQPGFAPALRDAILAASDVGVLFVAAAGNSTLDLDAQVVFPASYDLENTIAVAATDPDDQLASWSNFGALTVELGAPGFSILSTVPQVCHLFGPPPTTRNCDGSGYQIASGTSMAAPHVSAVLGLLRALHPQLSHLVLKQMLLAHTDPLPTLDGVTVSGGRLNAAKVLTATPPTSVPTFNGIGMGTLALVLAGVAFRATSRRS